MKKLFILTMLFIISTSLFALPPTWAAIRKATRTEKVLIENNENAVAGNGQSEVVISWTGTFGNDLLPLAVIQSYAVSDNDFPEYNGRLVAMVKPGETIKLIVNNGRNTFHFTPAFFVPDGRGWCVFKSFKTILAGYQKLELANNTGYDGIEVVCHPDSNRILISMLRPKSRDVIVINSGIIRKEPLPGRSGRTTQNNTEGTSSLYFIGVNGEQQGPYSIQELVTLARSGRITRDTMVWKEGMPQWTRITMVNELETVFRSTPPPLLPR